MQHLGNVLTVGVTVLVALAPGEKSTSTRRVSSSTASARLPPGRASNSRSGEVVFAGFGADAAHHRLDAGLVHVANLLAGKVDALHQGAAVQPVGAGVPALDTGGLLRICPM